MSETLYDFYPEGNLMRRSASLQTSHFAMRQYISRSFWRQNYVNRNKRGSFPTLRGRDKRPMRLHPGRVNPSTTSTLRLSTRRV